MSKDKETVYVDYTRVVYEHLNFKVFMTEEGEVRIPKSQIRDEGENVIGIPRWLARDRGLLAEGDHED